MRHRVAGKKLDRSTDHRRALRKNLMSQLLVHGRIRTTEAKAEAIRPEAERLITLAKRGLADEAYGVHARRLAAARLNNRETAKILFEKVAPRYEDRPGGYTRMLKLGPRQGDGAEMVILELV
ncbi:MAG: 50S ribosomal protein L17 [Anaerolineae bacterium]